MICSPRQLEPPSILTSSTDLGSPPPEGHRRARVSIYQSLETTSARGLENHRPTWNLRNPPASRFLGPRGSSCTRRDPPRWRGDPTAHDLVTGRGQDGGKTRFALGARAQSPRGALQSTTRWESSLSLLSSSPATRRLCSANRPREVRPAAREQPDKALEGSAHLPRRSPCSCSSTTSSTCFVCRTRARRSSSSAHPGSVPPRLAPRAKPARISSGCRPASSFLRFGRGTRASPFSA